MKKQFVKSTFLFCILNSAFCICSDAQSWNLSGNAGTNPSTQFVGTTDSKNFKIRTNNIVRMNITSNGKVAIGDFGPVFKLDVKGGSINTDSLYRLKGKTILITTDSSGSWGSFFAGPNSGNLNPAGAVSNRGNVAVGVNSFQDNVSGVYNTCLGGNTGQNNISGDRNTLVGYNAGISVNADNNTLIGVGVGTSTGTDNTIVGRDAGSVNSSGSNNVFIGSQAGLTNDIGSNNIAIGRNANVSTDLVYATVIGSGTSVTSSFCMVLGSMNQNVGIGTTAPTRKFVVSGADSTTVRFVTTSGITDVNIDLLRTGTGSFDWRIKNSSGLLTFSRSTDDLVSATNITRMSTASFYPATDNAMSLGLSGNRWTTVYATNGTINTSDARDKKEIKDLNYGMDAIMKLHPVSFQWKNSDDSKTKLGLIAQELQQVIPETVVDEEWTEDEVNGKRKVKAERLGVYYSDLIPVLIKGMQEMNAELKMQNEELKSEIEMIKSVLSSEQKQKLSEIKAETTSTIEQNVPNPFSQNTIIKFYIPSSAKSAIIIVNDAHGRMVKQFSNLAAGSGIVTVEGGTLAVGTYNYTLVIDGNKMDTKEMVLMK